MRAIGMGRPSKSARGATPIQIWLSTKWKGRSASRAMAADGKTPPASAGGWGQALWGRRDKGTRSEGSCEFGMGMGCGDERSMNAVRLGRDHSTATSKKKSAVAHAQGGGESSRVLSGVDEHASLSG